MAAPKGKPEQKKQGEPNLTVKQESYCQNYIVCGNQSAAYRIAFDAEAMNANTVAVEACRLHSDPNITLRIKELRKEAYERNKVTIDEIIQSLAGMIRFDIADLYDDDGKLLPLKQIPLEARQMINQLDIDELYDYIDGDRMLKGFSKKIRTYNKLDAVEKLMKHLGGYEKDNSQKPNATVVINLGDGEKPEPE